jgi:kinesin family protein C1
MMGAQSDKGMIPLSLAMIFQTIERLQPKGWTFSLETSMLEIYNETIRDLLSDDIEDN